MISKPSTLYRFVLAFFCTIAMLQQKASMSSQRNFDVVLPEDRVPPDKHCPTTPHMHDHLCSHNNIIQSNTIASFDTDSVPLYIDSCVTGGLTGFKSDFTPGTLREIEPAHAATTAGTTSLVAEGIATYEVLTDDRQLHTITTKMSYAPSSKYRLLSPQWLGKQERDDGIPKDKRTQCVISDEECTLHLHNRTMSVTIPHDPIMKVPVVRVNPGIRNFQCFATALNSVVQSDSCTPFDFGEDYSDNNIVALYSVQDQRERQHNDAAKLIEINSDLNDKLLALQHDYKAATAAEPLTPVQSELLSLHVKLNHAVPIKDIQQLAASGLLPKRLATCKRPACASCCYGNSHLKPWRVKGKVNK